MTLFITDVWMGFATWHLASSKQFKTQDWSTRVKLIMEKSLVRSSQRYRRGTFLREIATNSWNESVNCWTIFSHTVVEGTALWDLLARWWKLEKKLHFTSQSFKIVMSQIMRILHADVSVGRNNSSKKGRGDWLYRKRALKSSVSNLLFN